MAIPNSENNSGRGSKRALITSIAGSQHRPATQKGAPRGRLDMAIPTTSVHTDAASKITPRTPARPNAPDRIT